MIKNSFRIGDLITLRVTAMSVSGEPSFKRYFKERKPAQDLVEIFIQTAIFTLLGSAAVMVMVTIELAIEELFW